jgi:hypothetical protein
MNMVTTALRQIGFIAMVAGLAVLLWVAGSLLLVADWFTANRADANESPG